MHRGRWWAEQWAGDGGGQPNVRFLVRLGKYKILERKCPYFSCSCTNVIGKWFSVPCVWWILLPLADLLNIDQKPTYCRLKTNTRQYCFPFFHQWKRNSRSQIKFCSKVDIFRGTSAEGGLKLLVGCRAHILMVPIEKEQWRAMQVDISERSYISLWMLWLSVRWML